MRGMWLELAPLVLVSAVLPLQTIVTLALVRSSFRAALAWVAGMTVVRLMQGVLFGVILASSEAVPRSNGARPVLGTLLLVLALLLYVKSLREVLGAEDEDAPPPKWLAKVSSLSAATAFGAGAGFILVSAKFLIFTLAAIEVIGDAHVGPQLSVLIYVLFVALAQIIPLALLALGASSSSQSAAMLEGFSALLRRHNRTLVVLFGLIFGTWFLVKALKQLNVI